MGDVFLGAGVSFSKVHFSAMEIGFDLLNDRIFEGTEIGELTIAPDPTNFDGHAPLFKSVMIKIKDDDGNSVTFITSYIFIAVFTSFCLHVAALVTLEVPPVVREYQLEFTASVLLVRPEILRVTLEINLMDNGITALNPG